MRACPLQAHWLQGRPITDVLPMAGVLDRYRRFVVDGRPIVTGVAAVGDAWACTNPSAGRGISLGLMHAQLLRSVVANHLDEPAAFATAWHEAGEREVAPYFWAQIEADRRRLAEIDALRDGAEPPAPDPVVRTFLAAMTRDADVFRAGLEMRMCLATPESVFARPGFADKVRAAAEGVEVPTNARPRPRHPPRPRQLTRATHRRAAPPPFSRAPGRSRRPEPRQNGDGALLAAPQADRHRPAAASVPRGWWGPAG